MQNSAKMQDKKQGVRSFINIIFWIILILLFIVCYYYGIRWFIKIANSPGLNIFDPLFYSPPITCVLIIFFNILWIILVIKKSLFKKIYIQLLTWLFLLISAVIFSAVVFFACSSWF